MRFLELTKHWCFSSNLQYILAIISSNIFPAPISLSLPFEAPVTCMLDCLIMCHKLRRFCSPVQSFIFLLYGLHKYYLSVCNLLLIASIEFFFLDTIVFSSRMFILIFFKLYLSAEILQLFTFYDHLLFWVLWTSLC